MYFGLHRIHEPCTNSLFFLIDFAKDGGCDFDVDFCNWRNETGGDDFDWTRLGTRTPSSNTGPRKDRSGDGRTKSLHRKIRSHSLSAVRENQSELRK